MKKHTVTFLILWGILSGCSGETSKLVPLPDFEKLAELQDTDVELNYSPKVDMLFVIDESTSMDKHQRNLSSNIDFFVEEFLKNDVVDFHIGVTCTQVRTRGGGYGHNNPYNPYNYSNQYNNPSGITARCGTLLGSPPFLTGNTQNLAEKLPKYLKIGTDSGSRESVFENAHAVLTAPAGVNKGFYRPEAHLVLIFLTDAHDQSPTVSRKLLRDTLIGMKKGNSRLIHILSAIIPSYEDHSVCKRDDGQKKPVSIEEFTKDFDGQILSLCDSSFGRQLGVAGREIYDKVARTIFIENGLALPDTIELFYGSQTVDKKHIQYDPYQNVIILSKDLELEEEPEGTKLRLKYTTADVGFAVNPQN